MHARVPAFPDAASVVYTDGSQTKAEPKSGCGVYCRAAPALRHSFQFTGEQTIMRAELSAIYHALLHAAADRDLTIATDSLSSLRCRPCAKRSPARTARATTATPGCLNAS